MRKIIFIIICHLFIFNTLADTDTLFKSIELLNPENPKFARIATRTKANEEWNKINVKTSVPGELESLIGDRLYNIDEIIIEGPLNELDFETLWKSSFDGYLKVIDLKNSKPENDIIPRAAFYKPNEQEYNGYTYSIYLEKIILPDSIKKIDEFAFTYAYYLTSINFPENLTEIGISAFYYCKNLTIENLTFPQHLEKVGAQSFRDCPKLTGTITFPDSLQLIDTAAFYSCKGLTGLILPDNGKNKYIGGFAFTFCRFTEVSLPENCIMHSLGSQFSNEFDLKKIHLPNSLTFIPQFCFLTCEELEEVNMPYNLESVEESAFYGCSKLKNAIFYDGLKIIGNESFGFCQNLEEISLPSSLELIDKKAFLGCDNIKTITCKAQTPPQCYWSPFEKNEDTLVIIPIGTIDSYKQANGWNVFENFLEQDFSSSICLPNLFINNDDAIYDLNGKRVYNNTPSQICIKNGKKIILH